MKNEEKEIHAKVMAVHKKAVQRFRDEVEREMKAVAERPPSPSSARHAREITSKVREKTGFGWAIVREVRTLRALLGPGKVDKAAEKIKPYRLMNLWRGDDRVTLTVKIPPPLRDLLRRLAKRDGKTMAEMIAKMLTQAAESW